MNSTAGRYKNATTEWAKIILSAKLKGRQTKQA